jgi:hypothetical protein
MNTSAPASADSVEPVRFARFVCSARGRLDRVQAVPAAVDQALAVRGRDVADPGPEQHLRHRDTGCAGPGHHGAKLAELLAGHPGRAAQRGQRHDRGAVLVVMEDRDVEQRPEPVLDLEAARRRDIFQVDAAETRRERGHSGYDLVDAGAGQADGHGVDAGEPLEQQRLALHHRHRGRRTDVAQAEHGRAIGDDGDRVGHPGVIGGQLGLLGDRGAHPGDPRRVRHRQRGAIDHVDRGPHADLAAAVHREHRIIRGDGTAGVWRAGAAR